MDSKYTYIQDNGTKAELRKEIEMLNDKLLLLKMAGMQDRVLEQRLMKLCIRLVEE